MKYDTTKICTLKRAIKYDTIKQCYMNMMLSNIKNTHKHIKQFVYIYTLCIIQKTALTLICQDGWNELYIEIITSAPHQ